MSKKRTIRNNLTQIIDPENSPVLITIHYNDTQTKLMRAQRPSDGSFYWVGTPVDREGRQCRYSLTVESNGYMNGSAAINFITNSGWGRGSGRPDATLKSQVATEFRRAFLQSCILHGQLQADWLEGLVKLLQEETGLPVESGDITQDELVELTMLSVPHQFVRVANSNGLRFNIDIPKIMSKRVSDGYAIVMPGDWDDESEEVCMTSNLSQAEVYLVRRKGLKFAKVAQVQKRK